MLDDLHELRSEARAALARGDVELSLKALLAVIATQVAVTQDNLEQLYADEFIETCASWAVPYIGDLVGADLIYELSSAVGQRAFVANMIGYRRRMGTLLDLEQVSMDVSGMPAVGVEFFKLLRRAKRRPKRSRAMRRRN